MEGGGGLRASGDPTLLEAEWYWGDITRLKDVPVQIVVAEVSYQGGGE